MVASTISSTRNASGLFSPAKRICTVCAAVKRNGLAASGFLPVLAFALLAFAGLALVLGLAFLAFAALMTGQSKLSMQYIRDMVKDLPADFLRDNSVIVESFVALPMEVMVRFGKWDEVLAEPENYPDYVPFTRAFHHAARAIAFAAKGDTENARREQAVFAERAQVVPKETAIGNNTAETILPLVQRMLEGEILIAENKVDDGLGQLQAALTLEDALKYDEPPAWMIPVRHSLGANLMKLGRFAEAEQIYR